MNDTKSERGVISASFAAFLVLLVAWLVPYVADIESGPAIGLQIRLDAMLWGFISTDVFPFTFYPWGFVTIWHTYIPLFLFRYWVVYKIQLVYKGQSSRKRVLAITSLVDSLVMLPALIVDLLSSSGLQPPMLNFSLPLPTLLASVIIMVFLLPPPKTRTAPWD